MESELLKKLKLESDVSSESIKRLKSKIEKLKELQKQTGAPKSDDEIIKGLQEENSKLKEQIEVLKKELISLDGPVTTAAPIVKQEAVVAESTAAKPVEQPKQQQQAKGNKEAKKPNEEKKAKSMLINASKQDVNKYFDNY